MEVDEFEFDINDFKHHCGGVFYEMEEGESSGNMSVHLCEKLYDSNGNFESKVTEETIRIPW